MASAKYVFILTLFATVGLSGQAFYTLKQLPLDGLSSGTELRDIQQDQFGLLWLASEDGLHRFDGKKIQSYHHEPFKDGALYSNNIRSLLVNHNSRLLIGTDHGLHWYKKVSDTFYHYQFDVQVSIMKLSEDIHDYLWAWTDDGFYWIYHEPGFSFSWGKATMPNIGTDSLTEVRDLLITPDNQLWISSNLGLLIFSIEDRTTLSLLYRDESFSPTGPKGMPACINRDFKGRIWLGTSSSTYVCRFDTTAKDLKYEQVGNVRDWPTRDIIVTSKGILYLCSGNRVFQLVQNDFDESLEPLTINHTFYWPEADINFLKEDRLNPENIFIVLEDQRLFYLERSDIGMSKWHGNSGSFSKGFEKASIEIGEEGNWHIMAPGGKHHHTISSAILPDAFDHKEIRDLAVRKNEFYVATSNQICVAEHAQTVAARCFKLKGSISSLDILDSLLLVGYRDIGLKGYVMEERLDEVFHHTYDLSNKAGISSNDIRTVLVTDSTTVWLATSTGLEKWNTRSDIFEHHTVDNGLPANDVLSIALDSMKNLWVLTKEGLAIQYAGGTGFHRSNGLSSLSISRDASLGFRKHHLMFRSQGQNAKIIRDAQYNKKEVVLLRFANLVDASGERRFLLHRPPDLEINIPYNHNSIYVDFINIQPSSSFSYSIDFKLSGPSSEKGLLGDATGFNLNSLRPGNYTLNINATDDQGKLRGQDSFKFVVDPPFWLTAQFFVLILVFILTLILSYFLIIKDQVAKRRMAIRELRKSTAADFHDELGSRLTVISLYANMLKKARNKRIGTEEVYLDKILNSANELYFSMKDVIWSLKPEASTLSGLVNHLREYITQTLENSHIKIDLPPKKINGADIKLDASRARNINLICKEVVHNTLKHAYCEHFSFQLSLLQNRLLIRMVDDGVGIPADRKKGEGLNNMQKRAAVLGADLKIITGPGGTTIELELEI